MSRNSEAVTQLHAFVDISVATRLRELAETNDRSVSAELRRALAAHLEHETGREGAA
jgi:predicted transcriptional regulator